MMISGNELIQIKKFIDKLPDPIIIIDYVNDKLVTNSSVKKCFKNIKLNKFEDLKKIIPLKVLAELNSKKGREVAYEISYKAKSYHLICSDFRLENSLTNFILITLKDLTEIKWLEKIRTEFVGNLSHEIKTPLASIQLWLETVFHNKKYKSDNSIKLQKQAYQLITKNINRISTIVSDMKLLSDIEKYEKSLDLPRDWHNPRVVIEQFVKNFQEENKDVDLKFTSRLNSRNSKIYIHKGFFVCALQNLINNALQYSDKQKRVVIKLTQTSSYSILTVQDSGIGISKEHLNRLFERFYRVDNDRSRTTGGTGLGLAIVKHIMKAHKGKLSVKSTEGKGSTFFLFFPKTL